jgi:hypothetical protein
MWGNVLQAPSGYKLAGEFAAGTEHNHMNFWKSGYGVASR